MTEISYNNFKDSMQAYNIIREHIASLTQEQREAYANDIRHTPKGKQRYYYALELLTHLLDTQEVDLIANTKHEHRKLLIDVLRTSIYPLTYIWYNDTYYTHRLEFTAQAYRIIDFYIGQLNGEADTLAELNQRSINDLRIPKS